MLRKILSDFPGNSYKVRFHKCGMTKIVETTNFKIIEFIQEDSSPNLETTCNPIGLAYRLNSKNDDTEELSPFSEARHAASEVQEDKYDPKDHK